ncbi:uncharacterized protein VP01_386g12 [Puccinia sorghi]|uniref:DDE Tnp4 domain-containing protein n=1 Tax=Puccinia sorghi TaxID=27349 RepID=A0A0L6USZ8_9BASI|nr:uncharacterized protein VP01_386g12 [Puccinia sorghi]
MFLTCLFFLIHCNTDFLKKGNILPGQMLRPSIDPQDYYLQKISYGVATLVVCDNKKWILNYLTGWPGCSHDTRVWDKCELHQKEAQIFSPGQYLIGDSGCLMDSKLVPTFIKPPHSSIPCLRKKFNQHLASLRVCNKHCIGVFKGFLSIILRAQNGAQFGRING